MSTLSVPLTPQLEETINSFVESGYAPNKAEVVRKALKLLAEEEAVAAVLKSEQEAHQGKIFYGDPKKIIQKLKKQGAW